MTPCQSLVLPLLILSNLVHLATAVLVNRTIDDEYGDSLTGEKPTYFPPGGWTQGRGCKPCVHHLDPSQVLRGTWHDASQTPGDTSLRTITATFNGTAVYVYNVVSSYKYGFGIEDVTVTFLTFEIDGQTVDTFFSNTYVANQYGVQVFGHEGLKQGIHQLVINVPPGRTGGDISFVLFDYIEYTTLDDTVPPDPPTPSIPPTTVPLKWPSAPPSKPISGGAIVGGTIGGIAVVAGVLLVCFRRKIQTHVRGCRHPLPFITPKDDSPGSPLVGKAPLQLYASVPTTPAAVVPAESASPHIADAPLAAAARNAERDRDGYIPPQEPDTAAATPLSGSAQVSEARFRALEEQVMRMQAIMEAPPEYEI